MAPEHFLADGQLARAVRVIMLADMVESVRLIEQDEAGVLSRWLGFVKLIESSILPACEGRMIKVLGDGMLLEFSSPQLAVSAALAI